MVIWVLVLLLQLAATFSDLVISPLRLPFLVLIRHRVRVLPMDKLLLCKLGVDLVDL